MAAAWTEQTWQVRDAVTRARALAAQDDAAARHAIVRFSRGVLKRYSTSFFIVTRFLPPAKRAQVDMLYAAVRYPDEVVDSFPLSAATRLRRIERWRGEFERALAAGSIREALLDGAPTILAGWAQVTREAAIPAAYYHSFLDAMQADIKPRRYGSLDDLIENYIYGSAIVVGYFLAHIYGATDPQRAMLASRRLGIALQLTNFIRDIAEDRSRGRLYLPLDMLAVRGIAPAAMKDAPAEVIADIARELASRAAADYAYAAANLSAFSADCRMAIDACIRVYGELNERVANGASLLQRQSVPLRRKFRVLPPSKYWRLPLAYMGLEPA
jgi:15-cis-phytoene synthase